MIDLKKVTGIQFDGIDFKDYPDFSDAHITSADYEGEPMTDEQIEMLNNNGDFVYEKLMDFLY